MATYDYDAGKKRIEEMLDNPSITNTLNKFPLLPEQSFESGQTGWISAIFVDLRINEPPFAGESNKNASKVFFSLASEFVEVFKDEKNLTQAGVFKNCIYAVYTTPNQGDVYGCVKKAICINTCANIFNELLRKRKYPTITVGIGIGMAKELLANAENTADKNIEFSPGEAMTKALNYASLANSKRIGAVVLSKTTYVNILNSLKRDNNEKNIEGLFAEYSNQKLETFYHADIVQI